MNCNYFNKGLDSESHLIFRNNLCVLFKMRLESG